MGETDCTLGVQLLAIGNLEILMANALAFIFHFVFEIKFELRPLKSRSASMRHENL